MQPSSPPSSPPSLQDDALPQQMPLLWQGYESDDELPSTEGYESDEELSSTEDLEVGVKWCLQSAWVLC